MVAVLTRIFGVHNLPLVEDVVQDAFCRALDFDHSGVYRQTRRRGSWPLPRIER